MNLETFLRNFIETLNQIMYQPAGSTQLVITTIIALLAMSFVLSKVHSISGAGHSGIIIGGVTTLVIVFAMLSIYTMIKIKVLPHISDPKIQTAVEILLLTIAFFALAIPFTRLIFNTAYWVSFGAWVVALIISWAVIFGVSIFFNRIQYVENPTMHDVQQSAQDAVNETHQAAENAVNDANNSINNAAPAN